MFVLYVSHELGHDHDGIMVNDQDYNRDGRNPEKLRSFTCNKILPNKNKEDPTQTNSIVCTSASFHADMNPQLSNTYLNLNSFKVDCSARHDLDYRCETSAATTTSLCDQQLLLSSHQEPPILVLAPVHDSAPDLLVAAERLRQPRQNATELCVCPGERSVAIAGTFVIETVVPRPSRRLLESRSRDADEMDDLSS